MGRTRVALLAAAADCLIASGSRRTTMADIAAAAGVAKGTVYNHFRTRGELYRALAEAELERILAAAGLAGRAQGPAAGLTVAAQALREHPVLRRLRTQEPEALTALLLAAAAPAAAPGWERAGAVVADLVAPGAGDVALRWLLSWVLLPGDGVVSGVELLARPPAAVG